ncbi:MAG: hypothetical protein J1F07_01690 [Muribaculaceae bacterium]|nr:hypothetical protein [Muribaculaceae bacterium]
MSAFAISMIVIGALLILLFVFYFITKYKKTDNGGEVRREHRKEDERDFAIPEDK